MKTVITDGILYQYLRAELPEQQASEIADMIKRDKHLAERYDSICWIHERAQLDMQAEPAWDKAAGWEAISMVIDDTPVVAMHPKRSSFSFLKIAASFAILLMSSWLVWSYGFNGDRLSNTYASETLHDKHELPDGTVVWLGEEAVVRYSDDGRTVSLEGKAYFDVARDEQHPFELALETGSIEVLGTEFNVEQSAEVVQVSVTEGRVRFASDEEETILAAGQMASLARSDKKMSSVKQLNKRSLLWHEQTWEYDNAPLSDVLVDISSTFNTVVALSNQDLKNCTFSTSSTKAGLNEILDILRRVYDFNIERSTRGYILQGGVCNN